MSSDKKAPTVLDADLTRERISLLSALGSIASVFALAIVLLDRASANVDIPAQILGWRIIFFVFSMIGMAGTTMFTYAWAKAQLELKDREAHLNILHALCRSLLGLMLVGVFLDAFFASLYWRLWLEPILNLYRMLFG